MLGVKLCTLVKSKAIGLFSSISFQSLDKFHRITMVHLESKFMSKLDEYTSVLMKLFHSKGRTMGLRHQLLLISLWFLLK